MLATERTAELLGDLVLWSFVDDMKFPGQYDGKKRLFVQLMTVTGVK